MGSMEKEIQEELSYGIWKLVPLAVWWCKWKERNQWSFKGKALSLLDFKLYFLRMLYSRSQGV